MIMHGFLKMAWSGLKRCKCITVCTKIISPFNAKRHASRQLEKVLAMDYWCLLTAFCKAKV